MVDFFNDLADQLSDQLGLGENTQTSLNLGDFTNKIDQTQQRQYVQEGYLRTDQLNARPKQLEILMQEPDITVLVKKRAFTSLADNYQLDHMSEEEKLFYKTTKILFSNKCKQIASLERLSKIQKISKATGDLSDQLIPIIISLTDELNSTLSDPVAQDSGLGRLSSIISKVKSVYSFSASNFYTSWLIDSSNAFKSQFGQGTGVIEFCNVTNIDTVTTTDFGGGNINLSINDPYNFMTISNSDIERAISDATNAAYNKRVFQFAEESAQKSVDLNVKRLNDTRAARGARPIQFLTSPDTLLSKKVRALFEGPGEEVHFTYNPGASLAGVFQMDSTNGGVKIAPESMRGADGIGEEGLDNKRMKRLISSNPDFGTSSINTINAISEAGLFCSIIESIFNLLQIQYNSQSILGPQDPSTMTTEKKEFMDRVNYTRRKLHLHYLGKLCIQPMDQIHVYTSSKSRIDNKILGGLQSSFTSLGFLQQFDRSVGDIKNQFQGLFNPDESSNFQLEKSIFAGPDFPNFLWNMMRNVFVNETSGVHTFGGVITKSSSTFSAGSGYTVRATGADMTYYLEQGMVNFKPANDVFNGPLYDPLTPYKTNSSAVSNNFQANQLELTDENKKLLSLKIVKHKQGPFAGQLATEKNIIGTDGQHSKIGEVKQVFYSPDGLVYHWKEGIGTFTHLSNSLVIDGDSTVGTPALTKDPFAGQDVMNAISLCITGQPYNYATYYKGTQIAGGLGRDPQTGQDGAFSYFKSLTRDLVKNNLLWGNFIPFKSLDVAEATFEAIMKGQTSILKSNNKVNQLLASIQTTTRQLQFTLKMNPNDNSSANVKSSLQRSLNDQNVLLEQELKAISNQLQDNKGIQGLSIIGNDVSYDADELLNSSPDYNKSLSQPNLRRELRRKINFLTRRMSWQVRANEDKNLFIVDDSYDKDYDIQAFEKTLAGEMSIFNSEFSTVKEKIVNAAKILNLDVYCDPQGNLRCRPPQYNRVPSSVFYRLFQLKEQQGIQLYPQFLEDLFITQIKGLQNNLETIEDQIRLDGALLGASTDGAVYEIVRGFQGGQKSTKSLGEGTFTFLTNESSGALLALDKLYTEANIDKKIGQISTDFESKLNSQAGISNVFNAIQQSEFIVNRVVKPLLKGSEFEDASFNGQTIDVQIAQDRVNKIKERLVVKTGQQVNVDFFKISDYVVGDSLSTNYGRNSASLTPDVFKISNDIASKITERQRVVKQLSKALLNAKESTSLDSKEGGKTANRLLSPNISPSSSIPNVFESMIEDESYDDLGIGSGKRYIIEDSQILSYDISENQPDFVVVEVNGRTDLNLEQNDELQDTGNFTSSGNGNAAISAAAVDYDLWRMYGFKNTAAVSAPWLSQPESQLAPFAASILSRSRKNILRGNITIIGNEYMQPGDVVFLRSKDLLFYVTTVGHSFKYGSTFQTQLTLTYGHTAGDYIPTTLDIIGKLIYNNRFATTHINHRQGSSFNEQNVGSLVLDRIVSEDAEALLLGGKVGPQNMAVLSKILITTYSAIVANKDPNSLVVPKIQLRVFKNSEAGQKINGVVLDAAKIIKKILTGTYESKIPIKLASKYLDVADIEDPEASAVDIGGENDPRSPSQGALDLIRNINSTTNALGGEADAQITSTLYNNIIDVWVTFTHKESEI